MNNKERIENLKESNYQKIFGVKKETFDTMLAILEKDYQKKHIKGGRPPKLSVLDKLIIMLVYYREYRVMENIAFDYGVSKSTICDTISWVETTLIKDGTFSLPSKKKLIQDTYIEVVLIYATECEIERPKKKQKNYYSGKKKRHTLKLQVVADADTMNVICIAVSTGKKHDFHLFKDSKLHFLSIQNYLLIRDIRVFPNVT